MIPARCCPRILFALLASFSILSPTTASAAEDAALYGKRICAPAKMTPRLKSAVLDLQTFLHRMTGQEFSLSAQREATGIVVSLADADGVPAAALQQLPVDSQEACCVWPEGEERLWILSRSEMGLSHAVYLYLEQLGCRWYFPAEHWTIIPQRTDIPVKEPLTAKPAFRSRAFAGSGGFGGNLPLDPTRTLQARWEDWQRRNRFGGEFRIAGHSGEAFNIKHQAALEAHPEWRAMIDGQRVPWTMISKFCVGNPEVVELFVKDRLEIYRQLRKQFPNDPNSWGVSVEPADGGGHCTAPESLALGSVSDRVFYVANQVAKAVRQEFPNGHVTLFAYNEHAAVPSIPLEENVYVQVIPYAFQRTGLTPDQLLDAWSHKVKQMGVYDYWSIPDWSHDLPTFDPLVFGPERLRGWHRRGVDSFLCESTFSSGAMGLAWYIGTRLAWDPQTQEALLFNSFLADCFGPAAPPMRKLLERWSQGFYLTSHELALSYRDLQAAYQLSGDNPLVVKRIADYGRYVEYLRLRFEYLQSKRSSPEHLVAAERLMRHLWSIYHSSMIHAYRHSQLLARDEANAGNKQLGEAFDWRNKEAAGWSTIQPLTDEQVRKLVEQGVQDLVPQEFTVRQFTGELTPLSDRVAAASSSEAQGPEFALSNSLELDFLAEKSGAVFQARVAAEKPVRFVVTDPSGKNIREEALSGGADFRTEWTVATFTAKEPGLYHLQFVSQKRPFKFQGPAQARLSMPGWTNSQGAPTPKLYFYLPAQTERLAIYANYIAAGPPRFFDPAGVEVKPELIDQGHLLLLNIPAEQRGKVWSLDRAKCPIGPLQMLNAPNQFAFTPESLLVPIDAIDKQAK